MLRFVALLLAAAAFGQPLDSQDFEGRTVVEVEFEPPRQPIIQSHLERIVPVKQGEPLDSREVQETIHNLFETGRYSSNIRVEVSEAEGGVKLTFFAQPSWFIGLVRVTGVPPPPTESQLVNVADLQLGELYTEEKSNFAVQEIRRLLRENGYFTPQVNLRETENPESQQKDIAIEIDPGPRSAIGDILIAAGPRGPDGLPREPALGPEEVRRITKWREGKPFHQNRMQAGIERLERFFHKQDYWQAQARVTGEVLDRDENQVAIVLAVDRGPLVTVRAEGADFSEKQLQKYIPIYEEGVIDEDLLAEGRRNLRDYLQTQGYFDAQVEYFLETNREDKVEILYRVDRGLRHRVVRVEIEGNDFFDLETIRERMLVQEKSFSLRRGRYTASLLDSDKQAIEELYRSNGFRDVVVQTEVVDNYRGKEGDLAIFVRINEGTPTLVEDLTMKGTNEIPKDVFLPNLASAPGQAFSELNVATDRDLILGTYYDKGFQDARFSWTVSPGSEPNYVTLEYEIQEGESIRVRRPIVSGLNHTKGMLVRSQIRVVPGEPLSQSAMLETQRRLYDLGIFSAVDVDLQNPAGVEPSKNVLVQVEEARRWTVGVGGGAEFARIGGNTADVSSPLGDATFSPRITLELTRLNVRGIGHTASIRTRLSDLQQRALFTYEAPRWTGSDKWRMIVSGLVDTSRNVRTFTGRRLETALQFQHRLSKPSTALYRYTFRRTSIDEETLQISPELIPLQAQPVRVALLSGTYIQDRRDDPTDATKGIFNTVDLSFASGVWGSQADFFRFLGQNATYHQLGRDLVLARTLQFGLMLPGGTLPDSGNTLTPAFEFASDPDQRIPLSERFFGGGANSHRGFPVNQAGPRDPTTGFPIGGGALFVNTLELRFPLIGENIGGVLFHDAGNVYSRLGRISFGGGQEAIVVDGETVGHEFDYMVHAVGFGLRYRTPIGPVRFDVGYTFNPPRFIGFEGTREELLGGRGTITNQRISHFQFHFSLGQRF